MVDSTMTFCMGYYKTLFWSRFQTVFLKSVRQYSYWKSMMVKALQAWFCFTWSLTGGLHTGGYISQNNYKNQPTISAIIVAMGI